MGYLASVTRVISQRSFSQGQKCQCSTGLMRGRLCVRCARFMFGMVMSTSQLSCAGAALSAL